jgi:hypothetical protein
MRLRPHLAIAAVLTLALSGAASAQNWSVDTAPQAPAGQPKAKKGRQAAASQQGGQSQGAGKAENRQFGELEGWSPGKSPPKKKEKEESGSRFGGRGSAPVSMSPSGGMAVGMPF